MNPDPSETTRREQGSGHTSGASRRDLLHWTAGLAAAAAMAGLGRVPLAVGEEPSDVVGVLPGVAVLCGEDEPAEVRRAVDDLRRDLKQVLGVESPLLSRAADAAGRSAIVVSCKSAETAAWRDAGVDGWEAHAIYVKGDGKQSHVVLQGADARGAIYAVYEFCDRFLDVPPLWYWAEWEPAAKGRIDLPRGLSLKFPPPTVKWRAWFPNDTDLFGPWSRADPSHLDALYEAMLRLKLNCVEGVLTDNASFARPYRAAADIRAARDRGLCFCGHHVTVFGAAYRQWDAYWKQIAKRDTVPKLSIRKLDDFEAFWRYHVQTALREKIECVWIVGFRGNGDRPFWDDFSDAPKGDAERARVISEMMRRQIALLKQETGEAAPDMRCTLYNENSDFVSQGLLRPPDEPSLIWSFVAARRDHFPAADIRTLAIPPSQPVGYYFNYQFTSTGAHLVPAEGPQKMEDNFRFVRAKAGGPLRFSVVNMGNIREFIAEGSAQAAMMWGFDGYRTDVWQQQFCSRYFGPDVAAKIAKLFDDYYASVWQQRKPDLAGFQRQYLFQDLRMSRAGRALVAAMAKGAVSREPFDDEGTGKYRIVPADNDAADSLSALRKGVAQTVARLGPIVAECDRIAHDLTPNAKRFFDRNLRLHARWSLAANQWLLSLAEAADAMPNRAKAIAPVTAAAAAIDAMRGLMAEVETGPFKTWYAPERLWGVRPLADATSKVLNDLKR